MSKEDLLDLEGVVTKILPGGKFEVTVKNENIEKNIICHMSGKLRVNKINIVVGDVVSIAVSPYDVTNGVIKWRNKWKEYDKKL